MPFTPFHFGPGAAIKAIAPKHFSFTVFCFAQVATDCETAYYMLQNMYPWHRFFHTYVGATIVGFGSVILGRPLCQLALRICAAGSAPPFKAVIPLRSAVAGAFIGTYSHVLLDSIVHEDMTPFLPFSSVNSLYQAVSSYTLHAACVILGIYGAIHVAIQTRNG